MHDPSGCRRSAVGIESDDNTASRACQLAAEMQRRSVEMKKRCYPPVQLRSRSHIRALSQLSTNSMCFLPETTGSRSRRLAPGGLAAKGGRTAYISSSQPDDTWCRGPLHQERLDFRPVRDPYALAARPAFSIHSIRRERAAARTAVVNTDGGVAGRNRLVRFPDAHAESATLIALRQRMWKSRRSTPPRFSRVRRAACG